jgi:hypothetical protein
MWIIESTAASESTGVDVGAGGDAAFVAPLIH